MEQIEILCGFNGTLAYICAICLTQDRFYPLKLSLKFETLLMTLSGFLYNG